jgi:hypothetical protein
VHDWQQASSLFGTSQQVFAYNEFRNRRRLDGLHQMTFDDLHAWLLAHPDAFVVTDTKASNLLLLDYLRANARDIAPQLILQIYRLSELQAARQFHPRAVWLAIYQSSYPP